MASVSRQPSTVNSVLPPAAHNLVYVQVALNNQSYVTSGAFPPAAPDRKQTSLRWVGTMVLDFDLVDYLTHLEGWDGDTNARKLRMYTEYGVDQGRLDALKLKHRADIEAVLDEVCDEVGGACKPTYLVDSGWGLHAYFWLDEAAEDKDIDIVRTINKLLVDRVNAVAGYELADAAVHDAGTRLMRLVGSVNAQAKEKAGIDSPQMVKVVDDFGDANNRWDISESERYFTDSDTSGGGTSPAPSSVAAARATSAQAQSASQGRQLDCLIGWMLREKAVKKLYDSAKNAQDSEKDMSLACGLASHHHSPSVISAVLYNVRNHPNAHDGTDYYDRTAQAAWRRVHQNEDFDADSNYTMQHPAAAVHFSPSMSTLSFVAVVAQHDPRIRNMLWVDERTKAIEWETTEEGQQLIEMFFGSLGLPVPEVRASRRLFEDCHIQHLCRWIESVYHVGCTDKWREVAGFISSSLDRRNPVRDYLKRCADALPEDADDSLLDMWLIKAFGIEDTPLHRTYSRKWLVGGAARGVEPGVFIKSMLVLVGGQSAGKTSMFRILGGSFYDSPHSTDLSSKDAMMGCNYSWLLEMEEMSFMTKSATETVKKFITTETDKMRLPYGVGMGTFPRACFYAGTSNRMDILKDATGGDRFWCIELPKNAVCDFAFIRGVRDQLLGLAYRAWMAVSGTDEAIHAINLTREELADLREANENFECSDPAEEGLLEAVRQVCVSRQGAPVLPLRASWSEVIRLALPAHQRDSYNELTSLSRQDRARVSDILTKAGFVHKVVRIGADTGRFWLAPDSWQDRYDKLRDDNVEELAKHGSRKTLSKLPARYTTG